MSDVALQRGATDADLEEMAAVAAAAQAVAERHTPYLSSDVAGIRAEIVETGEWAARTTLAKDPQSGALVGWLLADQDLDLGRVWWVGPVVSPDRPWRPVADALFAAAEPLPPAVVEQELCGDGRFEELATFAQERGYTVCRASVALNCPAPPAVVGGDRGIRRMTEADGPAVAAIHDALFPGTHTPGHALVSDDDPRKVRWVVGDPPVAYVAAEIQPSGLGYVDFLGVLESHRRQGLGRALVSEATRGLFERGVPHVHLTVWSDNPTAIALYLSLGYVAERTLVPYRLGFPDTEEQ